MNDEVNGEERPLAWPAILDRTPVYTSGGDRVGTVSEVLGSEEEDIFHGLEVSEGIRGHIVLIPADRVTAITNKRITIALTSEDVRRLPPYEPGESYQLGFVGLFRRRLGWVEDRRQGP